MTTSKQKPLRIAIIAGEASGDFLGAGLISTLQKLHPNIEFFGIGGPLMRALGFNAIYPMEKIAVMGISDVLLHITRLKWIHHRITRYLLQYGADLFIGIDAPDFNLSIETTLRQKGIKTAHYVSPKIWAWRPERVHKIKKAVDLLLTIFPFETAFYAPHAVPVKFVGHPLADLIDASINIDASKAFWGYTAEQPIMAVLPGSRQGELKHMGPLFLDVMNEIQLKRPEILFMVPLNNENLKRTFEKQMKKKNYSLNLRLVTQQSRAVMSAADVVLVKSGTSTLEAALLKKPMVVSFKMSALTYKVVRPQVKVSYTSLPNLLANRVLVPEFIQKMATPAKMANEMLNLMDNSEEKQFLKKEFTAIHHALRQNANQQAAEALLQLISVLA